MTCRLWQLLGKVAFWVSWPISWWHLRRTERTRILVVCNGAVLLTRTWLSAGDWGLPGGGRRRRETMLQAARRELHEETGLDLPAAAFRSLGKRLFQGRGLSFPYELFQAEVSDKPALERCPPEITDAGWFKWSELPRLPLAPDVIAARRIWRP